MVEGRRCVAAAVADGRAVDATAPLDDALGLDPAAATGEADLYEGLAAAATESGPVERVAAAAADGVPTDGAAVGFGTDAGERTYRHAGVPCPADSAVDRVELFEDVTRLRERADRLDLFETLAGRTRDGLVATDDAGRVAYCDESFASRLGADPAALVGRPAEQLVAERDRDDWTAVVADLAPGDELTREFAFRRGGERVELSVALTGRPGGGVLGATRRPGRDAGRTDRVERYRRLVESAGDPMFVVDADDRIALANGAMGDFLGTDPADLEGRPVADPVPAEAADRIAAALETVRAGERRRWHDTELRLPDADGRPREFEVTFGPVRTGGSVVGTVGTFRDVTERERRRRELEQLRRLLSGVVRTDVADGVREIGDLADRLAERVDGRPATLAAAIGERTDALADLVAKTAAVERIVDADPEPTAVALDEAVDRAVAAADPPPAATLDVAAPSVDVRAVPVVDLAVRNLVENALVHSGEAPTVSVTGAVEGGSVALSVADDGPGIPDVELAALERGAETPLDHGSGVGLWLVEWVVAKSGGDLSFDTDGGTRVTVRFDRADDASGPLSGSDAAGAGGTAPDSGADVRVCHLDPDRSATARIREAAAGVAPTVAVERAEGVDAAVDALATGRVDCLVTDRLDDSDWDRLVDAAAGADAPVVCYAGDAHAGVDSDRLAAVDSVVEKGTGTAPAAFLVEKVRALVGADADSRSEGAADAHSEGAADPQPVGTADGSAPAGDTGDATGADADSSAGGAVRVETDAGTRTHVPADHPGFASGRDASDASSPSDAGDEPDTADPSDAVDAPDARDGHDESADGEATVRTATAAGSRRRVGEWVLDLTAAGEDLRVRYARDLTRAVARERRLSLLSALVDRARDCVSVVDANGEVVYHDEAFADLLGYDDMIGVHSAEYMAPGELEKGQLAVQRLLATPDLDSEVLDVAFETADGERVTLAVRFAVRREDGEYAGVVNVARDVTGAAADPRLERYRTLVESAGDPMFVVDGDGRLALVNEALERLLGRSRSALRGAHVRDAFPTVSAADDEGGVGAVDVERDANGSDRDASDEGDREAGRSNRGADGGDEWWRPAGGDRTCCVRVRGADGDSHRYEVTVVDPDGFDGAVCTCREVTARERRAEELARLKRVLGRVLRHNLRNELTLVTGHAQLIADAVAGGNEPDDADGAPGGTGAGEGGADTDDPLALARSIRRASDDLAATAATARAAERALERRDPERPQSVTAAVDAAAESAAEHRRPLSVDASVGGDPSVRAPGAFVAALEALFGALAADSDAERPTLYVRATEADGRVALRVSLAAGSGSRETLEPFVADPEAALDRHRDAGAWLFARVLDRSAGQARLDEAGDRRAVVVSLPATDDSPAGASSAE
ncbi:PAS domain S-box protein [Halosimplex marinum]|uniref:PAS domain S-box protein n=1 Tax=Halosimplex marinum TaxID=3396620 RepID=UPI003F5489D0